jgi:hypothetical protein
MPPITGQSEEARRLKPTGAVVAEHYASPASCGPLARLSLPVKWAANKMRCGVFGECLPSAAVSCSTGCRGSSADKTPLAVGISLAHAASLWVTSARRR